MKRVYWTVQEFMKNMNRARHLGTFAQEVAGSAEGKRGCTVWGGELDRQFFAVAWEWAEVRGRTVALADPMYVVSNIMLVEENGLVMDNGQKLVHLNSAVYCLKWQRTVMESFVQCDERMAA
jgi:hypothetical protein